MLKVPNSLPKWIGLAALLVAMSAVATAGLGAAIYGSLGATWSALNGRSIIVDSSTKSFGTARVGQRQTLPFYLKNISDRDVRILGSTSSCSCTCPDGLPMTLKPGERHALNVSVDLWEATPGLRVSMKLYTNVPDQPLIELAVEGQARPH